MKYTNQINILLVIIAGAVVLYTFKETYFSSATPLPQVRLINSPARGETAGEVVDRPVGVSGPRLNQGRTIPPTRTPSVIPEPDPIAETPSQIPVQTPPTQVPSTNMPAQSTVISVPSAGQNGRPATTEAATNPNEGPTPTGRRPAVRKDDLPSDLKRNFPFPHTDPEALKRDRRTNNPAAPPVRSSMPNRPPR